MTRTECGQGKLNGTRRPNGRRRNLILSSGPESSEGRKTGGLGSKKPLGDRMTRRSGQIHNRMKRGNCGKPFLKVPSKATRGEGPAEGESRLDPKSRQPALREKRTP